MASCSEEKKLILISSDNQRFEVTEGAARMSETIRNMIEDGVDGEGIPLPNVDSKTLAKVLEFCNRHAVKESADNAQALKEADHHYIESVKHDRDVMFSLISAANYLTIKELLDLTCYTVADNIKDFSPEQVRQFFNIENDFTEEEEEELRHQYAWAFH
ncbi:SKP1-like 11 [Perilla frutescens var. hirtella]|nr:SKP1-like 11 [Perilla frutescens var. hirtella]